MRDRVTKLAMAVAYTWLNQQPAARDHFLGQIVRLGAQGTGVELAIDLFTDVRLLGVARGRVREGTHVAPRGEVPPMALETNRYDLLADAVTALWSAAAAGDAQAGTRARAAVWATSEAEVRDILRIMSFDTALTMEHFASLQGAGADLLDDYLRDNPPPQPPVTPSPQ
jgi:hypothetical protein